ncbi:MAG: pilin [Patescibacteria group bacterium]|nr:pilin [Patescibacteria group bacterium]
MSKKTTTIVIFSLAVFCFLIFSQSCLAYSFKDVTGFFQQTAGETGLKQSDPAAIVAGIINVALGIVGVAFVVLFIYGGVLWMTSGGEEKKISQAKKILEYAVIGLVIVVGAYAITFFVTSAIEQSTGPTGGIPPGTVVGGS